MSWILEHWELLVSAVAIVLALLYKWYKGELDDLVAEVWGMIVYEARDVLCGIDDDFFMDAAEIIYDALPALAKVFVSEVQIANMLKDLRDKLVSELPDFVRTEEEAVQDSLGFDVIRGALLSEIAEVVFP